MRGERRKTDRDVLRDCWGRWTAILALFAGSCAARRRVDPRAYAALRDELIAACRSLAEAEGAERTFYAGLEETVKPWLNLRALERTDREILSELLLQCRQVERQLNGRRWRPALPLWWKPAIAVVAGGAVIGGLVGLFPKASLWVFNTLRDAVDTIWLTIKHGDDWQKASAVAVVVVVGAIYIVWRSARA